MTLPDLPDCNLRSSLSLEDMVQQRNSDDEDWSGLSVGDMAWQNRMMMRTGRNTR